VIILKKEGFDVGGEPARRKGSAEILILLKGRA